MLNPTKSDSGMFRSNPSLFLLIVILSFFYLGGAGLVHAAQEETKKSSAEVAKQADDKKKHTNALADETSPYLLMHAHNPVNWYPWGEEALAKAKKENKPIFLSIGYSSCHWCHVMERESFLDEEIAKILNDNFVCIKVDREERPDVDSIYMESLNTFNRIRRSKATGGWPLSMFLTPETKPFFGGTYFPARKGDRGANIGFLEIVNSVDKNWKANPDRLNRDAKLVTDLTIRELEGRKPAEVSEIKAAWSKIAIQALSDNFDPVHAGFRFDPNQDQLPKFPEPSNLLFLNNVVRLQPDNEKAKKMLVETCEKMSLGGIYDHLGGGFHRYSVDRFWAIPHFEKMLYDNAQLASAYAEAFELTKRPDFKRVVEGTLAWVEAEMVSPEGGFYSALDAESEGEEGKFYRWTIGEVKSTLTDEEYQLFAKTYRLNEPPNFEKEYYAPQLKETLTEEEDAKLAPIRKKLFDVRAKRARPLLDNKILSSWNGMMIRGFADAGRILKNESYLKVAARAADFCLENLVRENGALWRTYTKGEAKLNAYIDDYAAMIEGLLALHQATDDKKWLDAAVKLQQKQDELFWDEKHGGYFFTSSDHEQLLVRSKRPIDSALPSGNSISAANLAYLAKATSTADYLEKSKKTILSASAILERYPIAAPRLLRVADGLKNQ